MKVITQKEIEEYVELSLLYNKDLSFEQGLRIGIEWAETQITKKEEKFKPHVAEVVKCGDVNKPKSNDYPQEWLDTQRKELQRHYKEDFAEGMLSGSRKDIEDIVALCDHVSDARTVDKTGLVKCLKCGEWVNIYDL